MYRLGAQGRALQQQLQQRTETQTITVPLSEITPQSQQQHEIESFIQLLKSNNSMYSKKELLSYCVNYFPKVKNVDNLRLITALFFNNKVLFNNDLSSLQFDNDFTIIEAVWYMFQTKLRISEPTITKEDFFSVFLKELYENRSVSAIYKILVLTGVLLSKPLNDLIKIPETQRFYQDCYHSAGSLLSELLNTVTKTPLIDHEESTKLIVLSSALSLQSLPSNVKKSLPNGILYQLSLDLFVSPNLPKPIWENLNKLSFLIEATVISNTIESNILETQLLKLVKFSSYINQTRESIKLEDLKTYYFGLISIFQGFVKLHLNAYCKLNQSQIFKNFMSILNCLNELNFILVKLGTSGFKNYDFVLLNCINGGLELNQREFEKTVANLNQLDKSSELEPAKILLSLTLFEHITKYCSTEYFENDILPTLESFLLTPAERHSNLDPFHYKLILESSHQVVISNLSHLSSLRLNQFAYLHIVINQYQKQLLKLNQLLIISRQVTNKAQSTQDLNQLLHILYLAVLNTRLYPSHQPTNPIEEKQTPEEDRYPKLGLVKALIACIPSIQDLSILQNWLDNISELIEPLPNSDLQFKSKLNDYIWEVISNELNVAQLDVAIDWWYSGTINRLEGREARL